MLTIDEGVDLRGKRAVEQLIGESICVSACYLRQTPSTNTLALDDVRGGDLDASQCPKLYLTDSQTAGRGRHGRKWVSCDETLTFSLVVPCPAAPSRTWQLMALAVGVGVARALEFEFAPLQTKLKWPNDIHIDGVKAGGILLETTPANSPCVVAGVGLNVGRRPDLGDDEPSAGDVSGVVGRRIHRYEILHPLVESVVSTIAQLDDFADDLVAEFRARCLLTGRKVSFHRGQSLCEGVCRGVSREGELMIESPDGLLRVRSGEAQLVRFGSSD